MLCNFLDKFVLLILSLSSSKMLFLKIFIPVVVVAIIVIPIAVVFTRPDPDIGPVVNTTMGRIRGLNSEDGSYSMFLGIPYAVVDRRNPFGAVIPTPVFEDVFNAFEDTEQCPQYHQGRVTGSLDCLRLNIHVPKRDDARLLPVIVYIHGGGFAMGTSAKNVYGPKFLIRHKVIYVSFHYRLTAYGFMCLHTPEVPGNQGLKDQQNALRWIKNNIRAFGGDDENITIVGDSAGGIAVDMQLIFAEEGLFHKVITQSGTSQSAWGVHEPDLEAPFKIARRLGFVTSDMNAALEFLSNQTSTQVIEALRKESIIILPCLEKQFPNVESFMTSHPVNARNMRANRVPILSGYNDDELLVSYANMPEESFQGLDPFNSHMRQGFTFGENYETMMNFVRQFYIGDEPITSKMRRNLMDFEADFMFLHPTQRRIANYVNSGGTVYHYVFSYVGGRNMMKTRLNITTGGASHSDELGYLYDLPKYTETPSPDDQLIIDRITTMWTNFAKFGDPTPSTTTLLPVKWLPVTRDRLHYLNITKKMELRTRPFHQRLSFLDLFYNTNREYVRGYCNESSSPFL